MDDIIEFLLDLVFEIGSEVAASQKAPKWIRYPLIGLFLLLYAVIAIGSVVVGFMILDESIPFALILIGIGLVIMVFGFFKIRKEYRKRAAAKVEPFGL